MKKYLIIFAAAIVLSFMFLPALTREEETGLKKIDTASFSEDSSKLLKTLNAEAGNPLLNKEEVKTNTGKVDEQPEGKILNTSANDLTVSELEAVNNGEVIIKQVEEYTEVEENEPFQFGNTTNDISNEDAVLSIGISGDE